MKTVIKKIKPKTKSFNCKNCGAPVEIKILGQTLNVVCPSCKSIIDATDPNYAILQEGVKKKLYSPYIPLGSRGKLHGILWEVTGFVVKKDATFYWQEYLLFNPYHGYRWLVEVEGHFSLFKRIHTNPKQLFSNLGVSYKKRNYKLFNHGNTVVDYVEGEFFWRVKKGNTTKVTDYISPPFGLSLEKDKKEYTWTLGHHVEITSLMRAFNLKESDLPLKEGVGSLEPSDLKAKLKKMIIPMSWSLLAVFAIQMVRMVTADNQMVYETVLRREKVRNADIIPDFKSETFKIEGGTSNVMLSAYASARNAWIYLDVLLVDATTQKGIPIPIDVSYYYGSDWSEGSQTAKRHVFNVPDGEYYLNIKNQEGGRTFSFQTVRLKLYRDVVMFSNIIYALLLILIAPVIFLFKGRSFEVRRWSNSDYSPYSTGGN